MDTHSFENNEDFYNFIRSICSHLGELGFTKAHDELSDLMSGAWTTSSELWGELGVTCERILARDGKRLPPCLTTDIKTCKSVCSSAFT